ncbi:MAG TPA: hypothetical protein VGS57_21610 [Thermoanaerobaculia bacterium]|jgi:hypothetical protein|nr:hypothetical protein [Thermoanaerobaculia bacterium]
MPTPVTRWIGLSLGADLCWPLCFEHLLRRLDLAIPWQGEEVRVAVERVTIEPFDLQQRTKYTVVLDRLTHWYYTSREWIKKAVILDDVYVLNNPWAVQSMEKHTTYAAMLRLGMPIPKTWMVPPKEYEQSNPDLEPTLRRYAKLFDLGHVGGQVGYPLFMKPYDGGAWRGVSKIDDEAKLRAAYDESGKNVMHLQAAVVPFDLFVRAIGMGPQVNVVKYDPAAPLHDRYRMEAPPISAEERSWLEDTCLTINTFFGWDFNSCESLRKDGGFHPIDFANACPDSQVTSLHFHFPWLVLAKLRWAVYCAVTRRKMRQTLDWEPYYEVARQELPYREKLSRYAAIARQRLEADRFAEFCAEHLAHLDAVADEFFASKECREAVRLKVEALYPPHEVEPFTDLFFARIQRWRSEQKVGAAPAPAPLAG